MIEQGRWIVWMSEPIETRASRGAHASRVLDPASRRNLLGSLVSSETAPWQGSGFGPDARGFSAGR